MNYKKNSPIGFLDSGVGGISILKEAINIMPNEDYIYFGDSKNAPYGTKNINEIKKLTFDAVEFLLEKNVKGIVVACNTATSAAVADLRLMYGDLPLVGVEPALKPAVQLNLNKKILVMATPMTVKQEKFKNLLDNYKSVADIVPLECGGLMEFVESGSFKGKDLELYLLRKLRGYNKYNTGAIVLGCTHYPFIKQNIINILGESVEILDGGEGTAREIQRRLKENDLLTDNLDVGNVKIFNSSQNIELVELSSQLLKL